MDRTFRSPVLCATLVAALLSGCGARVSTRDFVLRAEPEANDQSPVPVEIVLVRDPAMIEVLGALSARAWFDARAQLERDHPEAFESRTWEVVPGQRLDIRFPFRSRKGVALYVFANYLTAGAHRVRVESLERFTIVLGRDGFTVAESG